jgi:protein-histidine pros-kinase
MGMLELTRQTKLSPEQAELLIIAGESAEALLTVVNDVLDFSKIEAGRAELEQTEFDLSDTVAEAARMLLVRAHQKKLDLKYQLATDVPQRIVGDPARLKQVLANLLGNAVKFTEKGQILLLVETETSNPDEVVLRFSVADTGIGIPPAKQKTIFQASAQADSSVTRKFGGTGLGLAISANIVALMKGRICVEKRGWQGFHFFLYCKVRGLFVRECSCSA